MRMTSACRSSSCKKPFFCASGSEPNWAVKSGTPILILSAAMTDVCKIKLARKIPISLLIRVPCCFVSDLNRHESQLVLPELLEKSAFLNLLKQGKIDKTFRRYVSCARLYFSHRV